MEKVTPAKQEITAAEWVERIRECRNSGMPVTEWCKQNGINPKTYYYHLHRVREKLCEQVPVPIGQLNEPIKAAVTIHSGNLSVEIADGTSSATIEALIRALKC